MEKNGKVVEAGALALEAQLCEKAKVQFTKLMVENARFIAEKCWVENLGYRLEHFNKLIEAARELGATYASQMAKDQIEKLVKTFSPLRALEMSDDVYVLLVSALEAKGLSRDIFFPKK